MDCLTGLDVVARDGFRRFRGETIGVVCHQASLSREGVLILDLMLAGHRRGDFKIGAVFGPQHGIWGHTQDNMIEWEGYLDERTGLMFYSLYGEHREPTAESLAGLDRLVFDVQDVGARYYTFIWSLANCMKACEKAGVKVTVLDRPNPIGGNEVEDLGWEQEFASFVGMHKLPVRHGLTVGEIGRYLQSEFYPGVELDVVGCEGWRGRLDGRHTGLAWGLPSPNMPTLDTAAVYPGMCLIEGTKMSEGRGTTRPFEIFGAPYVDGWEFADALNGLGMAGCWFQPMQFLPTFQKHAGVVCQGAFLRVTDRREFKPVLAGVAVMWMMRRLYEEKFEWQDPPYEYEYELWPIDILTGASWVRESVDRGVEWQEIVGKVEQFSGVAREWRVELLAY